jgi:cob(I)alamin adenosyltransferase
VADDGTWILPEKPGLDRDREAARAAWELARAWQLDESYNLVVFDEINYVISYGFISAQRRALGIAGQAP